MRSFAPRPPPAGTPRPPAPGLLAGFSVGGISYVDGPPPELRGVMDPGAQREIRRRLAFEEAAVTRSVGGNALRINFEPRLVLGGDAAVEELVGPYHAGLGFRPVYMHGVEERIEILDRCDRVLDALLERIRTDAPLELAALDDFIAGVEAFNAQRSPHELVRVLLTGVVAPPKWIVEAPSHPSLGWYRRPYSFATLWERYLELMAGVYTRIVRRYLAERDAPCLAAVEISNEPDYEWIPDEHRIERANNPGAEPARKYVTELHLSQIPEEDGFTGFEPAPWGYREQDAQWLADRAGTTPVGEFRWGPKFDWYVRCYADFQAHLAAAIRREADAAGAPLTIVSGGVTHNNIDYLLRMARANPDAFRLVDRIAVHPYHWPGHDIWDASFVSQRETAGWEDASPREFARSYLKRFDFLKEVTRLVRDPARGGPLFGKRIWLTEFGIPTKKLGAFNTPIRQYVQFIRERREPALADGLQSVVWEDLWDAFLEQVTPEFLRAHDVEAIFLYSLREAGRRKLDRDDDDRANFALTLRDGTPRMHPETFERLRTFLSALTSGVGAVGRSSG